MANITFIGLGSIGLQMANNLLAVGHAVTGYDQRSAQTARLQQQGGRVAENLISAVQDADFVVSKLPSAQAVRSVYLEAADVQSALKRSAIVIDCSTIGVEEARLIASTLENSGVSMLDAPAIGDARDARARLLTFAVGGSTAAFTEAKAVLEDMGERVVHVGKSGSGQAAVLCTQLMTIVNLLGAAEAFALAERIGLPPEKLFEVASLSTAASWALVERCPQSGLVPEAPSNNMYQGGFASERILHDLRLLEQAGLRTDARIPMTAQAVDLYAEFCDVKDPRLDASAIIQVLRRR